MYVDENGKTHYSIHDNIEDIRELPDDDDTQKEGIVFNRLADSGLEALIIAIFNM